MKNIVNSYVQKFKAEHRKTRRAVAFLLALALVVSSCVTWQLHATGIAMTNETYCGLEEHTHTDECYEDVLVCGQEESEGHTHTEDCYETETTLVCGKEESEGHTHTEDCYDEEGNLICGKEESEGHTHDDSCYETEQVLICGKEESEGHTHMDDCYETQLVCDKEEHTHTVECMIDETADVETASDWAAKLPDMTGVLADDVVAIAQSQLGYTESTKNFTLAEDGETKQGYTRYGAWYGEGFEYVDWDAMFASFCLYYAGIDEDVFPLNSGAYSWAVELSELGYYEDAADAEPAAGSLVFFDEDGDGRADRVGIVTEVKENKLTVIEGDYTDGDTDAVCENEYSVSDSTLLGYAALPEEAVTASPVLTSDGRTTGTELEYVTGDTIVIEPFGYEGEELARLMLTVDNNDDDAIVTDTSGTYPDSYYSYLTGETLKLDFSIDGGYPGDYTYRIYFKPMDVAGVYDGLFTDENALLYEQELKDQISLSVTGYDGLTVKSGDYVSEFSWDEDEEAYYLEFEVSQSDTAGGSLRITYPSLTTPGGELAIYGEIYDKYTGEASINLQGFLGSWTTEKQEFEVSIENDAQKTDGLILSVDENGNVYVAVANNPDQDIVWNISMEKTVDSHEDENIGEDLITGISVADTIALPDGITWTGEVANIEVDDTGYITFIDADGNTLLTLVNESQITVDEDSFDLTYDAATNSLIITWEIQNFSIGSDGFATSEIDNGIWQVRLNGDYLTYSDADGSTFAAAESHDIDNTVVYEYHYTWSDDEMSESSAPISIAVAGSNVFLNKTTDRSGAVYMGEDAYYTISLYNQGTEATTDLASLNDSALSNEQYISPENIWKMFFPETADEADPTSDSYDEYFVTDSGDYLTITITGAWVYFSSPSDLADIETLTDIEGNEGTVYLTVENYSGIQRVPCFISSDIRMTKVEGENKIYVEFLSNGASFNSFYASTAEELEMGLLLMGYAVTNSATYNAVWDLTDEQLESGEIRHYKVYSSLKTTFQYYYEMYQNVANAYNVADNTVYLEYDNGDLDETDNSYKEANSATAEYTSIAEDFMVEKEISSIDGETVSDTIDSLYDGAFVQYTIQVQHCGDGETEDTTLVDVIQGSQVLLVPLNEKNIAEIEAGNWGEYQTYLVKWGYNWFIENLCYEINGEYYIALEYYACNTYYNVWFDDDHCASCVLVDGRSLYTIETQIIWGYDNQLDGTTTDTIRYWTMIYLIPSSSTLSGRYDKAYNMVYLNETQFGSGLYDGIDSTPIVSGSVSKQILTSEKGASAEDETYATISPVDLNEANSYSQAVLYKLKLNTSINEEDVVFSDVLDVLPYTYGLFTWDATNVSVYDYSYATGDSLDGVEYEIYYSDEDGTEVATEEVDGIVVIEGTSTPAYQSIRWYVMDGESKSYALTVPAGTGGIRIYVELTFAMDELTWSDYTEAIDGNLRNTLSAVIDDNDVADTATVLHAVKKDAKAYLQKGVYWIESSSTLTDVREVYYSASSASVSNGEPDGSAVAYYITIYNPSSAYLYLTEIQDLVPDGFELIGVYGSTEDYYNDSSDGFSSNTSTTTDPDYPATDIAGTEEDVYWVTAVVTAEESEDGILRYTFRNSTTGECDLHYSDAVGCYYLAENEAISFIAVFAPGTDDETELYATNTIAMPYVTVSGDEVAVADVEGTAVDKVSGTAAEQNTGGCKVIDETEARITGFQDVTVSNTTATTEQWLTSDVTVHRGEIIPGIKKTVSSGAENGVSGNDAVTWTIEVTNDGSIPMVNYTISDSLDVPYQFLGNMILTIYDEDDNVILQTCEGTSSVDTYGSTPFLTIDNRGEESFDYTSFYSKSRRSYEESDTVNYGELINFSSGFAGNNFVYWDTTLTGGGGWTAVGSADWSFSIDQDDDNDLLTLMFTGTEFAIPAGGKLVLTIETKPSETASNGVYYNEATVTPTQSYNDDAVTNGEAVSAEDSSSGQQYVKSSDFVVVNGGYSTSSQKSIQSLEDSTKVAYSEADNADGVRYIVLDDEEETFRYTLEVRNNLEYSMEDLLVVDVLPEVGDYAPFTVANSKTARNSEFQVDLLIENIDWEVTVDGVELESSKYSILYSTYSDFTGSGMTKSEYMDEDMIPSYWSADPNEARSILIRLRVSVPSGSTVQISFNAKVSDSATEDDEAEPGEIAWNSFAYQYTTAPINGAGSSESATVTLWAAPRKVGVKIPDVPRLKKVLSGSDENITSAQTFRFLVHEGEQLTDFDYAACTETGLTEALDTAGKSWFVVELTVPAESTTEEILLDPDLAEYSSSSSLVYESMQSYTIVELPNNSGQPGNQNYTCEYMIASNEEEAATGNVLTFTYTSSDTYILVTAVNGLSIEESFKLPEAGGVGTCLYTLFGLALCGGAVSVLYWRRKNQASICE